MKNSGLPPLPFFLVVFPNFTGKMLHKLIKLKTVHGEYFHIKFKLWELKCIVHPNITGKQQLIFNMMIIIIS